MPENIWYLGKSVITIEPVKGEAVQIEVGNASIIIKDTLRDLVYARQDSFAPISENKGT
jgi:hypothetical protein